jgi:hypothetical protein
MIQRCRQFSFLLLLVVASFTAQSQGSKFHNDPDEDFKLAKELFQKEQFSLAYPLFKTLALSDSRYSNIPNTIKLEAKYYSIVCALQLNDPTAEVAAQEFIDLEHNTPRVQILSKSVRELRESQCSQPQQQADR